MSIFNRPNDDPDKAAEAALEHDEHYPRPRVALARNWVQPRRPYDHDKDYHKLPRFRSDFGREPRQFARPRGR